MGYDKYDNGWKAVWWLRWAGYLFVAVIGFYVFEDLRGAHVWKQFLEKHPEFNISEPADLDYQPAEAVFLEDSNHLGYFRDSKFQPMRLDRDLSIYSRVRKLEFPLLPFRRCGVWYPSSLVSDGGVSEAKAVELILGGEDYFNAFEDSLTNQPVVSDETSQRYIRVLIWRSLALSQIDRNQEALPELFKAMNLLADFDDGRSWHRSNNAGTEWLNILQLVWELLNRDELTGEQLKSLQDSLQSFNYQSNAENSARTFAATVCRDLDHHRWGWVQRRALASQIGSSRISPSMGMVERLKLWLQRERLRWYILAMPNGWIDLNKTATCRAVSLLQTADPVPGFQVDREFSEMYTRHFFRYDPRPTEAYLKCAGLAVAVERYHRANGEFPERLSQLQPEFIDILPKDPYQPAEPLRFEQVADRYMIYSIGDNRTDDKGQPKAALTQGDLVWRYLLPKGFTFKDYLLP